jgi:hypothetical protein
LAQGLRAAQVPVLVFLTPQNLERVKGVLDTASFRANRAALAKAFAPAGPLRYADWAARAPQGAFLDHCHLDAAGNEGLAAWIERGLYGAR